MAHYISTIGFIDDGKPVFESISDLDERIIAWDDSVFSSFLTVGQSGREVFMADCPEDLTSIAHQLPGMGPTLCLMERRFFEAHFKEETRMVGSVDE